MPRTVCPPGEWTTIAGEVGETLLQMGPRGAYVSAEAVPPANPADAMAVAGCATVAFPQAVTEIHVHPAQPVMSVSCVTQPAFALRPAG